METWKKVLIGIAIAIVIFFIGFFVGRCTKKDAVDKTIIEYVELPAIHDTITVDKPKYVRIPTDTAEIIMDCIKKGVYQELFPEKRIVDTIMFTSADTLKIVMDWVSERYYEQNLFNIDTIGKCDINVTTQYNRVSSIGYTYTPMQKQTTEEIVKKVSVEPFIGIGAGAVFNNGLIDSDVSAQAGLFIKEHYGVAVDYEYLIQEKEHVVNAKFLFKF